jgi:malate/lactate dehydrogenase
MARSAAGGEAALIDSVRFRTALAERLDVAPECVSAVVVGALKAAMERLDRNP